MSSSDIYQVKESPWAKKSDSAVSQRRRGRRHGKTFDEAVNPDLAHTHRRRSRNSGFRRLQHLMKDRQFSRRFWGITLGTAGLILILLIVWDSFFRYPKPAAEQGKDIYRAVVD
jgi:hypothetical protein